MNTVTAQRQHSLKENGMNALEALLRVTAFRPLASIPVTGGDQADRALFLLDADLRIAVWYPGAEIIYQYKKDETVGWPISILGDWQTRHEEQEEFSRSIQEGRFMAEGWQLRKDGARFWANMMAVPMHHENGDLQGFAVVVRDFSDQRQRHEKLRRGSAAGPAASVEPVIVGVVSGEFDRIPGLTNAFELVGHSRAELLAGRIEWSSLKSKNGVPVELERKFTLSRNQPIMNLMQI